MRWFFLVAVLLAAAAPVSALAQQQDGVSCAAVADNGARLACYDAIFRQPVELGDNIIIESERLIPALPTGRKPALMIIMCTAGAINVRFDFAGQVISGTSDVAPITFQLDQSPTSIRSLTTTDNTTQIEFQTSAEASAFLEFTQGREQPQNPGHTAQTAFVDSRLQAAAAGSGS